jgi:hypothetical protein
MPRANRGFHENSAEHRMRSEGEGMGCIRTRDLNYACYGPRLGCNFMPE